MKPKIYIRDRIYVPSNSFPDLGEAKRAYSKEMYREAECNQCEYRDERLCAVCETCPNYLGVIKLYHPKTIKGIPHIGLPVGDKRSVERKTGILFDDYRVVDLRVAAPLQYKIKFTIDLREHQKKLAADFLKHKYGLLEAPPRTGKTVMMLYLGLKLGQRMLLLAHQHEYLQQFLWHIEGNEEEGIPKCTNLPEIQERVGKKLYGFPKTDQDFKTMQFMVMTYQQFISEVNGKRRFDLVASEIGTVAVDECFTGDHRVLTDLGLVDLRSIVSGSVKPTVVWSRNTEHGVDEFKPLESVTRKLTKRMCCVTAGGKDYICTPTHLFWSNTRQTYVEAQHLKPNEDICSINADRE